MPVIFSFLPESIDIWSTFCKCLCSLREINFVLTTQWARLRSCHVTKKLIKNSYGRKVFSVSIFCLFFFCALSPASEPGPMETPLRLNFTRPKLTSFADSQGQPCLRVSPSEIENLPVLVICITRSRKSRKPAALRLGSLNFPISSWLWIAELVSTKELISFSSSVTA